MAEPRGETGAPSVLDALSLEVYGWFWKGEFWPGEDPIVARKETAFPVYRAALSGS